MDSDTQAKVTNLKSMHDTLENMHEHVQMLEKQKSELEYVDSSLEQMKDLNSGAEILVQLASGIFATAKLDKIESLRVNVGADIVVEKSLNDTKLIIKDQIAQITDVHRRLTLQIAGLVEQFEALRGELANVQVSQG